MIIVIQKAFSVKGIKAKSVLAGLKIGNFLKKTSERTNIKSGSRKIAESMTKSFEEKKLSQYKKGSSVYERRKARLKKQRKDRIKGFKETAQNKLQDYSKVRSSEQLESKAQKIADKITVPNIINTIKEAPVKAAKSVMKGAEKAYKNTGQVFTEVGTKFREHPIAYPGWFSGDAVNYVGAATGHPEVLAVPVGTIVGGAGLAGESGLFPRKLRRKFRQNSINYKKRRILGQRKGLQKLSPAHDWSLQKSVQNAHEYTRHIGGAGQIGYLPK